MKWILLPTQWYDIFYVVLLIYEQNVWRNAATVRTHAGMKNDLGKCDVRRSYCELWAQHQHDYVRQSVARCVYFYLLYQWIFVHTPSTVARLFIFLYSRLWFSGSVNCTCACALREEECHWRINNEIHSQILTFCGKSNNIPNTNELALGRWNSRIQKIKSIFGAFRTYRHRQSSSGKWNSQKWSN